MVAPTKKLRSGSSCGRRGMMILMILLLTATVCHLHFNPGAAGKSMMMLRNNIPKTRRKFVSYTPSKWESMWLKNMDAWQNDRSICQQITVEQKEYTRHFLNSICTSHNVEGTDWCKLDDHFKSLWYNPKNTTGFDITFTKPKELADKPEPTAKPIQLSTKDEHVFSKFTFLDETTGEKYVEYIEPLVSHLRHPLAKCVNTTDGKELYLNRAYVLPPPLGIQKDPTTRFLYFDAGASSWGTGPGGPSLSFFYNIWKRYGIVFDRVQAYEMTTLPKVFYETVPEDVQHKVLYRKCAVSSSAEGETIDHPFIPHEMNAVAQPNDYVLFKLDIDSPTVESGSIKYILENDVHVDEVMWEHHVKGNYLMAKHWGGGKATEDLSLRESYEFFYKMRLKGIRAHSWI